MSTIPAVLAALRQGELVVVTDDDQRENEGDLIMIAEKVTPAAIAFMATYGRGLICVPLTQERATDLELQLMPQSGERFRTAFTESLDARHGITTGISAFDRAHSIRLLSSVQSRPTDFVKPGHLFPLIAREGGVLARRGHTEAAVDLARLAGCTPVGVLCEIMNDDGTMARQPDLQAFVARHGLQLCTIAELVRYREEFDSLLEKTGEVSLPSHFAEQPFDLHGYRSRLDGKEHVALVYGDVADGDEVLVRVHSECLTGDVFHSARCDCGEQLQAAIQQIITAGRGVVVYLRQEGRGIGLINKIRAYHLQDQGMDTVEANVKLGFPPDLRDYSVAAQILSDLKVRSVRLLTNNPRKLEGLREFGVTISKREPLVIPPGADNRFYLQTKKERLGHLL